MSGEFYTILIYKKANGVGVNLRWYYAATKYITDIFCVSGIIPESMSKFHEALL
jgi:hypothetical protein